MIHLSQHWHLKERRKKLIKFKVGSTLLILYFPSKQKLMHKQNMCASIEFNLPFIWSVLLSFKSESLTEKKKSWNSMCIIPPQYKLKKKLFSLQIWDFTEHTTQLCVLKLELGRNLFWFTYKWLIVYWRQENCPNLWILLQLKKKSNTSWRWWGTYIWL